VLHLTSLWRLAVQDIPGYLAVQQLRQHEEYELKYLALGVVRVRLIHLIELQKRMLRSSNVRIPRSLHQRISLGHDLSSHPYFSLGSSMMRFIFAFCIHGLFQDYQILRANNRCGHWFLLAPYSPSQNFTELFLFHIHHSFGLLQLPYAPFDIFSTCFRRFTIGESAACFYLNACHWHCSTPHQLIKCP
jgi:hypothetical protein